MMNGSKTYLIAGMWLASVIAGNVGILTPEQVAQITAVAGPLAIAALRHGVKKT